MLIATAADEPKLDEILERHGIALVYRAAFSRLIETGEILNANFRLRLNTCLNYQECADECLKAFPAPEVEFARENPPRYIEWRPND